ncbi:MAG TPA: M48 family metalloprotease [Candidatus Saccharimonadales bacterium]|nr:M48 family metalloprotease [Candidatus Saccharimonadales bacterium]
MLTSSCGSTSKSILPSLGAPSEDEETRISRELRREAKKYFKFINNPEAERYVDRIGRRILAATGPLSFEYRFFVIEDDQLNAFSVPGGSIYMNTGLIERAKTTDEVAGVLGHEITHAKGHHMARSSGPDAISILSLLSMVLLAKSGSGAQAAGMVGQAVAATRQLAFSRQLEMEADTLGTRYMAGAGYDPKGTIAFLKILDQERALNPIDVPAYILSHPISQERIANAELVVRSLGDTHPRPDDPDALKKVQMIIRNQRSSRENIVGDYEKLVQQSPQSPELLYLLGYAQQLQGQLPQAQRSYEKSRQLKPDNPGLQRDLGRLYGQIGEFVAARAAFDKSLALEPNEPLTYLYMGEMLEKSGDLRSAAGAYLNAQNLAPLWDRPPSRLGNVYAKLDRMGDGYYYLGRSLMLQDEDEKAIVDYEKALKIAGADTPRGQVIKEELNTLRSRKR